jgi:hypothetical protein
MTDQQRSSSGYRGALPPAQDRLARPWVLVVIGLFVLMFVLAFLGFPSALTPDPTPFPSLPAPSGSGAPSVVPSS